MRVRSFINIEKTFGVTMVIQAHGLNETYCNWMYQHMIVLLICWSNSAVCVSETTRHECIPRDIPKEQVVVVPNGISSRAWDETLKEGGKEISERIKDVLNGRCPLSVGRLTLRKCFDWFVS